MCMNWNISHNMNIYIYIIFYNTANFLQNSHRINAHPRKQAIARYLQYRAKAGIL